MKRPSCTARPVGLILLAPALGVLAAWGSPCQAQSLFQRPIQTPPPVDNRPPAPGAPAPAAPSAPASPGPAPANAALPPPALAGGGAATLEQVSLFAVTPPKPRTYQKHDKVEIIINETSLQKHEQSLDTTKDYDLSAELSQFPSFEALLLNQTLQNGIGATTPKVGVKSGTSFKGEGTYERTDRFTARISALVIDVKPNGMLVLEAKESMQSDEEVKTMVVSGLCDPKDLTNSNTVQSDQLANLSIRVEHEGQVKNTGSKGLIPRLFEGLFNF